MTLSATAPADPRRSRAYFIALMFGNTVTPIFWLAQLILSYLVSSRACYGSDHPTTLVSGVPLRSAFYAFDAVAIAAALAGGVVSFLCWRALRERDQDARSGAKIAESRMRFMAIWGMLSSPWFLGAIVFNTIGSIEVRLCVQ